MNLASYRYSEGTFTTQDQLALFYRFYQHPDAAARTLLILHGQGEHSGRYQELCEACQSAKMSVAIYDQRGHGRSQGREVYVGCFEEYVEDARGFIGFLEKQFGVAGPVILLGNSLGGLVAVCYAIKYQATVKALILSAPCLGLSVPKIIVSMNRLISGICPFIEYRNPIRTPFLTHDKSSQEAYQKDTLIRRKITAKLADEIVKKTEYLSKIQEFELEHPLCMLLAGSDKIVKNSASEIFFNKTKAPIKRKIVYENLYHEIFHEENRQRAFDDVLQFIAQI